MSPSLPSVLVAKDHVYPIVAGLIRVVGEGAGTRINIQAIETVRGRERSARYRVSKVIYINLIVFAGVVSGDVVRARRERDRTRQIHLLPTARGFAR